MRVRVEFARAVADRVVRYRTEHELTQAQLATMTGMTQPGVARLESGGHEPTIKTLERISAATDIEFVIDVVAGVPHLRPDMKGRAMKKSELIDFLNEYDEEDYDVRVTDETGFEFELVEADWSNGPWLVIDYDQDELLDVLGAEKRPQASDLPDDWAEDHITRR